MVFAVPLFSRIIALFVTDPSKYKKLEMKKGTSEGTEE
jgi:hypothetical protein